MLHDIIASQSQTIQVLELFEMENWYLKMDLDVASNYWTELDNLLDDQSFSHLKEIRLLFAKFVSEEDLAPPQSERKFKRYGKEHPGFSGMEYSMRGFVTEEAVSLFKSYALKASEKGVQITYGLTEGRDGLVPLYH